MDMSDYLRVFRRNWLAIAASALVGALFAWALYLVLPASYTAEASTYISVQSKTTPLLDGSQFSLSRVASYPQLAWSRSVLAPVISELDLHESVDSLRSKLTVTNPTGTVFVNVDASDDQPKRAARIANAVAASLSTAVEKLESATESGGRVTLRVASTATVPTQSSSPSRWLISLLGLLVGVAIGCCAALVFDRRRSARPSIEQVEAATRSHFIARLPRRRSRRAEKAFRTLRIALLAAAKGELPGVLVMVPVPDTALVRRAIAAVAADLADGGRRVVLVQVSPGRSNSSEFAEVLSTGAVVERAAEAPEHGVLSIAARAGGSHLSRRVVRDRVDGFVEELRSVADVGIIVATERSAPLDVSLVAPFADRVLLVVDSRVSQGELVLTTAELATHRVKSFGVVLIGES